MYDIVAMIVQVIVLVIQYYLDPERAADRKELQFNDDIESVGREVQARHLRMVGLLIDRELRRKEDNHSSSG